MFPTRGKADAGPATGTALLSRIAGRFATPQVAIGGITAENVAQVMRACACGVAVITAIVSAEDITAAARQLRQAIDAARM